MRASAVLTAAVVGLCACRPPATVMVQADPGAAEIHRVTQAGDTLVGKGSAQVRLADVGTTRISVKADGYQERDTLVSKTAAGRSIHLRLTRRLVRLTVLPYDAEVYVDGQPWPRTRPVDVDSGAVRTVEIRKPGFKTITRQYANRGGTDVPPASETIELSDRSALLLVSPSKASLESGGKQIGIGNANVIIPHNGCTTVRAVLRGYRAQEYQFCQKDGVEEPQTRYEKTLSDREVTITTQPATAAITVNGQAVGTGEYTAVVRDGACVVVKVSLNSYLPTTRPYCAQDNTPAKVPDSGDDFIKLDPDEAWPASVESDQANVNFDITVNATRKEDEAWRTLSEIITSYFDVLEVTDRSTGYLRTGWNIRSFPRSVVRTRVILKLASSSPLKYTVKLASEEEVADASGKMDIKDDQQFHEYPRILVQYKDLINELQTRLR